MIDVQRALAAFPHCETFCSVERLHRLVESLRSVPRCEVEIAGRSANGLPIHHVRFGAGSVKAFFVASPHCMEPIGSVSVFGLMTLLSQNCPALCDADVEWHIVPCIDPDGALLNEGWTQKPFTLENYVRNYYVQPSADQVDMTFPVSYEKMEWSKPSPEASVLKRLLDRIRPDFYHTLHNTRTGGAFFYISRDIGGEHYQRIYELLRREEFPLQAKPLWEEICAQFGAGIVEDVKLKKYYDYLARRVAAPEKEDLLRYGVASWEYLEETQPGALRFCAEMGYVLHPSTESEKDTGRSLRQFLLRLDADNKYLASVLLDEWEKVKDDLDAGSPFYRAVAGGWTLPEKERLIEGGFPLTRYPTRDILSNPKYDRTMTEADLFKACMIDSGFFYHLYSYPFVRLLKASRSTARVRGAIDRLERAFGEAHEELARHVDFTRFRVVECDRLARVQLGSGLLVLNSLLERPRAAA